jgi:integrative and conjugative element protein (TIGR02256 family)
MYDQFHSVGIPMTGGAEALIAPLSRRALAACREDRRFTIIDIRRIEGDSPADVIVVECKNDRVPSKNTRGIRYVERLALVFWADIKMPPDVRALRKDFPATEHQNSVGVGAPASLCLYFEPWLAVMRSWTGRRFLEHIVMWLGDVAAGELHRADQPVEQFYFTSPWELVLPAGVREHGVPEDQALAVRKVDVGPHSKAVLTSSLHKRGESINGTTVSAILVDIGPVVSGQIEPPPHSLGELAQQLERRGSKLIPPLVDGLIKLADGTGISGAASELGLLIFRIPIARQANGPVESFQLTAFLVEQGLGQLGKTLGTLQWGSDKKRFFHALVLGDRYHVDGDAWKSLAIDQIAVLDALDSALAHRVTGVTPASADFDGVLVGAGSLGSQLGDIWAREAWGRWTVADPDLLKPHNLPRHRGYRGDIGIFKAWCLARIMAAASAEDLPGPKHITDDILTENAEIRGAIERAKLVVDASTTLHVPRTLANMLKIPRCTSVFFTPSGQSSVILLEDATRTTRLDALEAQYYRAILRSEWGSRHLAGHRAREFWIGAGCREVTTLLSPELVAQHSGLLARRLRMLRDEHAAAIRVWEHDDKTGSVTSHEVLVAPTLTQDLAIWTVRWDEEIRRKVRELRAAALPNETGGVLVGYVDQVARVIQVVDAMPPPPDSERSPAAFERGQDGVSSEVARIADRTAGVVGYIGEWHSHPDGIPARPSPADYSQLLFLTNHLRDEGLPATILIVGDTIETFSVGDVVD